MSETLPRIIERQSQYEFTSRERSLVISYYCSFLYDDFDRPKKSDLIGHAACARNIASMWADLPRRQASKVPADNASPIAQAARIMFFVAELLDALPLKAYWAREASIAYIQSGNLAAARIALSISRSHSDEDVPGDILLDAILTLKDLTDDERSSLPHPVTKPWRCANDRELTEAQEQLFLLCSSPSPKLELDKALGYRISQTLPLLGSLSLVRVVRKAGCILPSWYRKALARANRLVLLPSQEPAIGKWLSASTDNGLLCTPTSSGKTFVAEVVCIMTLEKADDGLAILVVPYQAIAYAVEKTLRERLKESQITVVGAYGQDEVASDSLSSGKVILVATPERLDLLLLAQPGLLGKTHAIVLDELHMLSQSGRGALYECLIARMLLEQEKTGYPIRIFGMSAVISNTDELATWLRVPKHTLVVGNWRPNPLIPAYWHPEDKLFVVTDQEAVADEEGESDDGYKVLEHFCPDMPDWPTSRNEYQIARQLVEPLGERVAWYSDRWQRKSGGPVVVFCSSRKQSRELALVAARNRTVASSNPSTGRVRQLIKEKYLYLSLLDYCLERGVAYHNAALPAEIRRSLEDAFQAAAVPVVYATTTLAEGSDFPFRSVVIASPSHYDWDEGTQSAMSPLLLRNIAGRGGRTSGHLIGDCVQMYTPLSMTSTDGTSVKSHEVFLQHLLDPAQSIVRSALASGVAKPERTPADSHLHASFDKIIDRWPNEDGIVKKYCNNMFDASLRNGVGRKLQLAYEDVMLGGANFSQPLATRNSPLRLTSLGEAVLRTGYDAHTASVIWQKMKEKNWFRDIRVSESAILESCAELGGAAPDIRELKSSNRRPLKEDNFPEVVLSLLDGGDIIKAYRTAEGSGSAATRKQAQQLIAGKAPIDSTAHERVEAFIDDLKQKIVHELPKLIRAMMLLLCYDRPSADVRGFERLLSGLKNARKRIE